MNDSGVIRFQCPRCDKGLRVTSGAAGKRVRCPTCSELVLLPLPPGGQKTTPTAPAAPDPKSTRPVAPPGSRNPGPAPRRRVVPLVLAGVVLSVSAAVGVYFWPRKADEGSTGPASVRPTIVSKIAINGLTDHSRRLSFGRTLEIAISGKGSTYLNFKDTNIPTVDVDTGRWYVQQGKDRVPAPERKVEHRIDEEVIATSTHILEGIPGEDGHIYTVYITPSQRDYGVAVAKDNQLVFVVRQTRPAPAGLKNGDPQGAPKDGDPGRPPVAPPAGGKSEI